MRNRDESFIAEVIPSGLLSTVIDWIKDNLKPDDVFDDDELFAWCKSNANEATEVCPDDLLRDWANDYAREE